MVEVMISEGAGGRVRECERVVLYGKKNEKRERKEQMSGQPRDKVAVEMCGGN